MMSAGTKARLDRILNKLVSRKLTVFLIATYGLFSDKIPAEQWVTLAIVYIGTQAAINAVSVMKGFKPSGEEQ
jgi:ABC-type maltose transport system permease subunit